MGTERLNVERRLTHKYLVYLYAWRSRMRKCIDTQKKKNTPPLPVILFLTSVPPDPPASLPLRSPLLLQCFFLFADLADSCNHGV